MTKTKAHPTGLASVRQTVGTRRLIGLLTTTLLLVFLPGEDEFDLALGRSFASDFATVIGIRDASAQTAMPRASWWEDDIWRDPDRPFHYYGEAKGRRPGPKPDIVTQTPEPAVTEKPEDTDSPAPQTHEATNAETPIDINDFSDFTTLESLKAEREKRLSVAIMDPTPDNMASYQAINAHVLSLSARFAAAWQLSRMAEPQYDFTAVKPSAAFAVTARNEDEKLARERLLAGLKGDAGLVFIGNPKDAVTGVAAGPVAAFARLYGLDVMAIAAEDEDTSLTNEKTPNEKPAPHSGRPGLAVPGFEAFDEVLPDNGRVKRWGIRITPALLLVPSPEAMAKRGDMRRLKGALAGRDGFLLATGAVSGEEIARRIALLLGPDPLMTGTPALGNRPDTDGALAKKGPESPIDAGDNDTKKTLLRNE